MKLVWSARARRDLDGILTYIAAENPQAARRVAERIRDAAAVLRTHPLIGRQGAADTREVAVTRYPYVIVYRITEAGAEIARVLHTSRDRPSSN